MQEREGQLKKAEEGERLARKAEKDAKEKADEAAEQEKLADEDAAMWKSISEKLKRAWMQ